MRLERTWSIIRSAISRLWVVAALPLISILLALGVGAVVIIASELLISGHELDLGLPLRAYGALIEG